jgi:acyl carrier protein
VTTRAEIITRITDRVQFLSGADPATLAHDKPLVGETNLDSLDLFEMEMMVEEEFGIGTMSLSPSSTIDSIADTVIAALGVAR